MQSVTKRTRSPVLPLALVVALISTSSTLARADSAIYSLHRTQEPCYDPDSAGACKAAKYHRDLARSATVGRTGQEKGGSLPSR